MVALTVWLHWKVIEETKRCETIDGEENKATESIILSKTGINFIGRLEQEPYIDANVINEYADLWRENLLNLLWK